MGNNPSVRRRPSAGQAGPHVGAAAEGGGYPGAQAPPPTGPHYVHPNMYGGQRAMPQGMQGIMPYVDGARPAELRGQHLYPWRQMPRQALPQMQKTYTIKNDVNLKKGTLKLVPESEGRYHIEFDFDASTPCRATVFFVATEVEGQHATYAPREGDPVPAPQSFPKGLGQKYRTQPSQVLAVSSFAEEELQYNQATPRRYPIIVKLESIATPEAAGSSSDAPKPAVQSQSTFATLVHTDAGWTARVLKQTIQVGARSFELQEIYGIDQSSNGAAQPAKADDMEEESGRECVICMTEPRDTTVLPCRHMCMCNKCAKVLRLQSNKCPICRCNVESLLQIKVKGQEKVEVPVPEPGQEAAASASSPQGGSAAASSSVRQP